MKVDADTYARFMDLSPVDRDILTDKLLKATKENLRKDYGVWCRWIGAQRGYQPAAHHQLIINKVQAVVDGTAPKRRLLIHAPPGSAKSTYTSEMLPPYLLNKFPRFNLIGASNTATLAQDFSERAIGIMDQNVHVLATRIKKRSAELWTTKSGGRYRAAGVGVAIAGNRADGVLIDDPVKSQKEANSETQRESVWNWFISDLRTRLKPDAWIIVIMTRWHEDDLGGRLLDRQGDLWDVLSLPAQAYGPDKETGIVPPDPLGREPGGWLWGDDGYGYGGALRVIKDEYERAGAARQWGSLFQQNPTPGDGTTFKVDFLTTLITPPHRTPHIVRAWDLAATEAEAGGDPDWTVGLLLMRTAEDRYVVLDVVRFRGGPEVVERRMLETARADGHTVRIGLPQDPGAAGKAYAAQLVKMLSGFRVEVGLEMGDKEVRANGAAAQVNIGNMSMSPGSWNAPFKEELRAFPAGKKDDQVDALSRAFMMVALNRPLVVSAETLKDMKRNGLRRPT